MSSVLSSLFDSLRGTLNNAQRVPAEILLAVSVAVLLSWGIADPADYSTIAREGAMTAVPTLLLLLAISTLYELKVIGSSLRWGLTLAGVGAGLTYGILVLDTTLAAETWRWFYLTSGVFFGVMMTPWAAHPHALLGATNAPAETPLTRRTLAWQFNLRLGVQLIVAGVYATFLTVGTLLGILAFDTLFEMSLDDSTYAHAATWIYAVGGTGFFVTALPAFADRLKDTDADPPSSSVITEQQEAIVYRAASLLLLPLLGLYLLILYAYGGRVLLTGEATSNLLSPLALGAAALGLVSLFLVDPLLQNDGSGTEQWWLSRVLGAFPIAYLPLLPMPAWAIWVRVQQHGWTEFRYLRMLAVAGSALCFGWTAWKAARGAAYSTTVMPGLFAFLLLLGAVGPWGALSISEHSQIAHLRSELRDAQSAASDSTANVDEGRRSRSQPSDPHRRTRYLFAHFGGEAFRPLLAPDASIPSSVEEAQAAVGLPSASRESYTTFNRFQYEGPLAVPGAGTLHELDADPHHRKSNSTEPRKYQLQTQNLSLIVFSQEEHGSTRRDTISLRERLPALSRGVSSAMGDVPQSLLTFELPAGQSASPEAARPHLLLEHLSIRQTPDTSDWTIERANGHLFVPAK